MAELKTVALSEKAYSIATKESDRRKDEGFSSSISAVVSEAVVKKFGGKKE